MAPRTAAVTSTSSVRVLVRTGWRVMAGRWCVLDVSYHRRSKARAVGSEHISGDPSPSGVGFFHPFPEFPMSKRLFGLVVVAAVAAPAAAQDDVKKIIDKAIAAHGGLDTLKKYKASKSTI